jgi:cytochrome c biogenesis protein CcdA
LLSLAFAAGLVATLNPCGFAMLPAYLTLLVRGEWTRPTAALGRAVAATAAMVSGFLAAFGTFGLLTVSVASIVQRYVPYATVLIGIVVVALGIWLSLGRKLATLAPLARRSRWAPTARISSMFGYGVSYAIASLSCTAGPFLAITAASVRGTTVVHGMLIYLAYAAGFSLLVGVLAIAVAFAGSAVVDRLRRFMPYASRLTGALLIVVGLYVGYYGLYEVRLFSANDNPSDPLIAAAGRLQGALAGWVYQHGARPLLVALAVLLLVAFVTSWRRRRPGNPARSSPRSLSTNQNERVAIRRLVR